MVWKEKKVGYYVVLNRTKAEQKRYKAGKTFKVGTRTRKEALDMAKKYKGRVGYGMRQSYRFRKSPKKRRVAKTFGFRW